MTLSEFCAHDLVQYVDKSTELEELSIQWNGLPYPTAPNTQTVPDLNALHSLTYLTMQMRNDVFGVPSTSQELPRLPAALEPGGLWL